MGGTALDRGQGKALYDMTAVSDSEAKLRDQDSKSPSLSLRGDITVVECIASSPGFGGRGGVEWSQVTAETPSTNMLSPT